ncbi:MAG: glycosyltransferase family 9 protein [Flavobacteriaceae bacterium]|nr:glycosyltransferase family 9 protein [Flavobacteriaceae bacterium]
MKILVIRFSSIGDLVLTTPVLRGLKNQLPFAEIHVLTKSVYASLLEGLDSVDTIWNLGEAKLIPQLQEIQFDAVIDLQRNWRSLFVKLSLWSVPHYTYNKKSIQRWLFVITKWARFKVNHVCDRYWETAFPLGVFPDKQGIELPSYRVEIEDNIVQVKPYLVAILGGTYTTKKIPKDLWIRALSSTPLPIVLIGGEADYTLAQELAALLPERVMNCVGKLSLQASAKYIENCQFAIGGDTGFTHIARAYKKSVLVIWGNTHPGLGFSPDWQITEGDGRVLHLLPQNLSCHPCSKLGHEVCPRKHFHCMKLHSAKELALLLENLQGISS